MVVQKNVRILGDASSCVQGWSLMVSASYNSLAKDEKDKGVGRQKWHDIKKLSESKKKKKSVNLGEDVLSSPPTPPPGLCYFQNKMLKWGEIKKYYTTFFP